ncbi:hypothetical protein [Corallococcus exercitus]|uniref:hypothetical protein n=1 Tax=Corallococcus exercitus TaxID=2316736 RepID=UPI0035D40B4C
MYFSSRIFVPWGSLSHAGRSLYVWSFYIFALGLTWLLAPQVFLTLAHEVADANLFWIRVAGALLTSIAFMCHQSAVLDVRPFFAWAVLCRTFIVVVVITCTLMGKCQAISGYVACIDFGASMWTFFGLRRDRAEALGRASAQANLAA